MKIALIGSSKRFDILNEKLKSEGNIIEYFKNSSTLSEYLNFDCLVLPIPTLNKEGYLNLKDNSKILIEDLLDRTDKKTVIIACNYTNEKYNVIDINKREDFAFLNAIPTAEAAIVLAIQTLGAAIYDSKCLISGFGRIGKMLAMRLKSLNAQVTVSARNPKDLAYIEALGFNSLKSSEIKDFINDFDIIFQTVPNRILTKEVLANSQSKPPIIELSSACLGTDVKGAEDLGYKVIDATNLPEKITPNTAGTILYDVVMRILLEKSNMKGEKLNEQN